MNKVKAVRICFTLLVAMLLTANVFPITAIAATNVSTGKIINVVYDDSGSMVTEGGKNIPRWSQAKYALEVFSAMMRETDVMNIYPMSLSGKLGLTLYGNDQNRVAAIHEMNGQYRNTPFSTVTSAAQDLLGNDDSMEKWLIVITDGQFDDGATPAATVQQKLDEYNDAGIKTAFLAIGDNAPVMQSNISKGAYAEKAADGTEVLTKVTSIANQIFEHLVLSEEYMHLDGNNTALSVDIPINQIIVFAQGDNVSVGQMSKDGEVIKPSYIQNVKYSDVVPTNYPNAQVDTSLSGMVVAFDSGDKPFESGIFEVSVQNADTVEYYYSPGVTVDCELTYNGQVIKSDDELYAGDYEVAMSFKDPLTGDTVQSQLLRDVEFSLIVTNDGEDQILADKNGSVTLVEGDVEISARAHLPGHVELISQKQYTVLPEPIMLDLVFDPSDPTYSAAALGENTTPIILKVSNADEGSALSEEEWRQTEIDVQSSDGLAWDISLGEVCGTWELRPIAEDGTIDGVSVGEHAIDVSATYQIGNQYAYGVGSTALLIEEYISTPLKIEFSDTPDTYDLNSLESGSEILVTVYFEDPQTGEYKLLDEAAWNQMNLKASSSERVSWNLNRNSEMVSTWVLKPEFYGGDPLLTSSGDVQVVVSGEGVVDELVCRGEGTKKISFLGLSSENLIKLLAPRILIALIVLLMIIGYIKKKRLRIRGLNPRCSFKGTVSPKQKISKDFLTVILPYVSERATVKCHKSAFQCNFPDLRIQATGRRSFKILNKSFDLKKSKICGEHFSDMETLHRRNFSFGNFDITSVNPKTGKDLGTFSFN